MKPRKTILGKDLAPLSGLTNLASLYLSHNQITSLTPVTGLPRLVTLHADDNRLTSIAGLEQMRRLSSVSLARNRIADVTPLTGLRAPTFLFLENNRIKDLRPLTAWITNDLAGPKYFAPFAHFHLKGNRLSGASKKLVKEWTAQGVRIRH